MCNLFGRIFVVKRTMGNKYVLLFLAIFASQQIWSQQMTLKKGTILQNLPVHDSISDTFSLYLPTYFTTEEQWPLLIVCDLKGEEKRTLSMFLHAAEEEGYILAAPKLSDTLSLSSNVTKTANTVQAISGLLPIHKSGVYTAGQGSGARFANLAPLFIKRVKGTLSIGASIANIELLSPKRPFHFIGIMNKNDYNYSSMKRVKRVLDRFKFPNHLLLYQQTTEWPEIGFLSKALQYFTLMSMRRNEIPADSVYIQKVYKDDLEKINDLKSTKRFLATEQHIDGMMGIYGVYKNLDSLRMIQRELRKDRIFKGMKRGENAAVLKESLLKEDYDYYLEEDVITHNFNNLGWWNYQMTELNKFIAGTNPYEKQMGNRLKGYVNALAEDNIDIVKSEDLIDEDALAFLYMLKTVLDPENFDFYLKIISLSAKNEDFGTALFYLEEALKNGFNDADKLHNLEHTALLRIDPKFNEVVSKYLKGARYQVNEK
ncbi:alpha/beta hydrolase [Flagellimonas onchidii]|uniref:alpha/beta hydrolase n=1 Tax=Flagellimonas onchidii TaxID=2562684 RepID=UPI001F117CA5|nr:alpha/beta hydrolase [Allomuricauda onchidii]